MRALRRGVAFAGSGLGGLLLLLALGFALLQTTPGKSWLATALGRWLSDRAERVAIGPVGGLVPFDMTIDSVTLSDAQGPRIVARGVAIAIAPADLLAGRLRVRRLALGALRIDHRGQRRGGDGGDLSPLLHPRLAVTLERLQIDRIELAPALLGEAVVLTLSGSARIDSGAAAADLDLHRIDGGTGVARLHLAFGGNPPQLTGLRRFALDFEEIVIFGPGNPTSREGRMGENRL